MSHEPTPILHRVLWAFLAVFILSLFSTLAFRSYWTRHTVAEAALLPQVGEVGAFSMTDADGRTVTEKDLAGKVWVAQFFFTECPGPCPAVSRQLFLLQQMLGKTDGITLVSISIDPENDTPAALKAYAARVGADPRRWLFLRGTPEATRQLVFGRFMIGFKENPKDAQAASGRFIHSTKLALVDGTGAIRGYYEGLDVETPQKILSDISALLREPR